MLQPISFFLSSTLLLFLFPLNSHGELYRCLSASGQTEFTSTPCNHTAQPYKIKNNHSLKLKDIQPPTYKTKTPKNKTHASKKSKACHPFTATELRNLRVKDRFKKGMPASSITKRFGAPEKVITKSGNAETWKYKGDRVKRTFQFKDNCLLNWKVKWHGKKSKISKYQN